MGKVVKTWEIVNSILVQYNGEETEIIIPEEVTAIANEAFDGNNKITKVIVPESVHTIGHRAFANCTALREITMYGVKHIYTNVFRGCVSLQKVDFQNSPLQRINFCTFKGCNSLREFTAPPEVKWISNAAFSKCTALRTVRLPEKLVEIKRYAFSKCYSLRRIELNTECTHVEQGAFHECGSKMELIWEPACKYYNQRAPKTAIIFMGIQGSGKTYYYNQHFKDRYEHINLDELHTRNKEMIAIEACIANGKSLVIDNTNPTKKDRERYISKLKEAGYQVVGYFFESKVQDCIRRNAERTGKECVPNMAIAATSNKLEMPSYDEGFDKLYFVKRIEENRMAREDWRD